MLFSSVTFLFMFLPLVCAIYLLVRQELKNYILLAASLVFYGWGEPRYLAIMLLTIIVNYIGAIGISRYRDWSKPILIFTIIADLSVLFYFKYFNFVVENVNSLCGSDFSFVKVIMPIGISFYTFQSLSYLVDVYRRDVEAQKDIYKLALYITLFPQLVAGPIVKYHDVQKEIEHRDVSFAKVAYGTKRFIIGLAKKILLANTFGEIADEIFNLPVESIDAATAWLGAIAYSMQLYFDFSGYSDMAIGLGSIFGFKFLENFNYPYISKSITEFWRRWHISLSSWFREYLYIPLGGNRCSIWRTYINLFIVFLATGIWHGASWNFVVWGLWHGFFIILERMTSWHKKEGGYLLNGVKHIYTIMIFVIGWVMFRAETMNQAFDYLKIMLFLDMPMVKCFEFSYFIDQLHVIAFAVAFVCVTPVFSWLFNLRYKQRIGRTLVNVWLLILLLFSVSSIAASTYNPFIYFRF